MPHPPTIPADLVNRAFLDASTLDKARPSGEDIAGLRITIEGMVLAGNSAFAMISAHDTAWHGAVFGGSLAYDEADEEAIVERYRVWMTGCERMLPGVEALEGLGIHVEGAEALRTNLREVRGLLTPDNEFFEGEGLDRLTAEAVAAHERGETDPFEEMGD